MNGLDLNRLLSGTDDESILFELHCALRAPRNDAQRNFRLAWEAIALLGSDGFEMLLEQGTPLEHYATALGELGLPHVQPIFSRVLDLIPPGLRQAENEEALFEHLRGLFEPLNDLLAEFYDASADIVPIAARFVREHRSDFSEYAS
jgi:hypothetical protein